MTNRPLDTERHEGNFYHGIILGLLCMITVAAIVWWAL